MIMTTTYTAAKLCPKCGCDTNIYDSRVTLEGTVTRRRRCPSCGTCYETVEHFHCIIPPKKNRK